MAFNRISEKPIKIRSGIYRPDVVVVLDPSLVGLVNVTDGLKFGGILVVNTSKSASEIRKTLNYKGKLFTVDATHIAREELGVPITNTTMLGLCSRQQVSWPSRISTPRWKSDSDDWRSRT